MFTLLETTNDMKNRVDNESVGQRNSVSPRKSTIKNIYVFFIPLTFVKIP